MACTICVKCEESYFNGFIVKCRLLDYELFNYVPKDCPRGLGK